ncbi:MAG: hemolysin family protein [Gammaproteobacteria bacterium]|nr:hemolysin family protein [Gammaproteobacteria bacterium]
MEVAILVGLIVFNGLFAMAEIAILTAKRVRLESAADKGDEGAAQALKLADNPNRFLSTVQVGITSIGVLSGIVGEATLAAPLRLALEDFGVDAEVARPVATGFVVVIITYFSIVVGELIPKRIAQTYPEVMARIIARPIAVLALVTRPFVHLLSKSTELLLKVLSIPEKRESEVTEEEIYAVLKEGAESGVLETEERTMMQNLFRLDERKLVSLMVPVADVVSLDLNTTLADNLQTIASTGHARYPVVREDWRHVAGVLSAKALVQSFVEGSGKSLENLLDEPLFVPESSSALDLFTLLQKSPSKMALVVDEYGAVLGIVTMQDVIEAITGQFTLSGQKVEWGVRRDDGSWLLEGTTPVPELKDLLQIKQLPEEDRDRYSTLSGMFLLLRGAVPKEGDAVHWSGWIFEVVDMDGNAIDKILARRGDVASTDTND